MIRTGVVKSQDVKITSGLVCVYRCLVPGEAMRDEPELAGFMENPNASWWVGPHGHVMAYPIRNGKFYNFNLTHEGSVANGASAEQGAPLRVLSLQHFG
jgi:hypothetical protein